MTHQPKAQNPTLVTLLEITMLVSELHSAKAQSPILVTLLGMSMQLRELHIKKELPQDVQEHVHLNICGNCRMNKKAFLQQIGDCKGISTYFKRIPDEEIPELFTTILC